MNNQLVLLLISRISVITNFVGDVSRLFRLSITARAQADKPCLIDRDNL